MSVLTGKFKQTETFGRKKCSVKRGKCENSRSNGE